MTQTLFALPTEPLLEEASSDLRHRGTDAEASAWLQRVADAPDRAARGTLLFVGLRENLATDACTAMLRSLLANAASGDEGGILGLAAMVHIQAPGEQLLDSLREFAHLHRLSERLHRRAGRGEALAETERILLADVERLNGELGSRHGHPALDPRALPDPREIGPAAFARRAFARVEAELRERGTLDDLSLEQFLRLCDLELRAHALRASSIAARIDPVSSRHLREIVPMLNAMDVANRELRHFLVTLAQERRSSLFFEHASALRRHLLPEEVDRLLARCMHDRHLSPLGRIFVALERHPLSLRQLAYFVDRLYAIGDLLVLERVRNEPIDLVEALLISCEFAEGQRLCIPLGERVRAALVKNDLRDVTVGEGELTILAPPEAVRALMAPLGLPRHEPSRPLIELDPHESIKDLVMHNMNNTSVLLGFLKNQKIVSTPGIVALIVRRCRGINVLDTICETRTLHSGFANKDVPLELLKCPMRIPIKTLRRFINVRYVSKVDLRRLAVDRSSVRREVSEEAQRYLKSLN